MSLGPPDAAERSTRASMPTALMRFLPVKTQPTAGSACGDAALPSLSGI
jgi:hypothetical protein